MRDCICNYLTHTGLLLDPRDSQQNLQPLGQPSRENLQGLDRNTASYPLEHILTELGDARIAEAPCPRFKDWTHDLRGPEFTLDITIPSNIVSGTSTMCENLSKWCAVSLPTCCTINTTLWRLRKMSTNPQPIDGYCLLLITCHIWSVLKFYSAVWNAVVWLSVGTFV